MNYYMIISSVQAFYVKCIEIYIEPRIKNHTRVYIHEVYRQVLSERAWVYKIVYIYTESDALYLGHASLMHADQYSQLFSTTDGITYTIQI